MATSIDQAINLDINPNSIISNLCNRKLNILIAGCGTGQHILNAQRYKNAQITGIDLSLSSLGYAQRKINEFGINNVELIQMDILEVELLKEQYDIIESSGVLHHMNDPSQGLKKLLGSLKKNGFLKLGLYSDLARQTIVEARDYIFSKDLKANDENIRHFRKQVISGDLRELKSLKDFSDFYSLSEVRDLCFHAQEHRFNINQLQEILQSNELKFLGFFAPSGVPKAMLILLVPIEVISYLSRPVSLSVRLFANMMAGHTLLKVIGGFVFVLGANSFIIGGALPVAFLIALTGLEIVIAFLQAYVFAILTCLYINDAIHLH